MNDGRLEEGPRNGGPIAEALNAELRSVERSIEPTESYGIDVSGDEERGDVVMEEPTPEREMYSPRNVLIRPLHNGYVVKLDCHEFAFETSERAMKYVGEYLKDPHGTEQKWWKKELFK